VKSDTLQFLFQAYGADLASIATGQVANVISVVSAVLAGCSALVAFMIGKQLALGDTDINKVVTRIMRLAIVSAMLTVTAFNTYITTWATQTIPQKISASVSGNANNSIAQTFDDEVKTIVNFSAQARKQAQGITNLPERLLIYFWEGVAKFFIWITNAIVGFVNAVIPFMLPVGAVLMIFFIFEATSPWAMRWVGKMINLFLVMFLTMQIGAYIAKIDSQYIHQYGVLLKSNSASSSFSTNAGSMTFSSLGVGLEPGAPVFIADETNNAAAAVETLENIAWTMAYGFAILMLVTGVAGTIGNASGSVLGPVSTATSAVIRLALRR
jgi:hypothetical protein